MSHNSTLEEEKANAPMVAKLRDGLKNYKPSYETSQIDTLDDRYRIDLEQPLAAFNTENAKAYVASDAAEPSKMLFAHVCSWGRIQRYRTISLLKGLEQRALTQLVAAGNVRLSTTKEERHVIFYEKPEGVRLSELIRRKAIPVNISFIYEHILNPIATAIQQLADMDTSHGLINPDNIFLKDMAVLGPCVSESCGLDQPFYYESVERMQAHPHAKGDGSVAHDYYAMAILLLEILHGPDHFAGYTKETLIPALFKHGAYAALMMDKEVPEVFYDFFRGTLTLNPEDRWNGKQIMPWLAGKRFNVLHPPTPMDAVRPYDFGDKQATTRRELAYLFSTDWEHMIASLHNNQLAHWVSMSLRNKELSEVISRLSRTAYDLSSKNETQTYETLMNIILLLDPHGPLRIRNLAMNVDGIDSLCVDLYDKKAHYELQVIARFIEANMLNYWLELQHKMRKSEFIIPPLLHNLNIRIDRLRGCIRNPGIGFGLERMLYDLNPEMHCISPTLASYHVTNLQNLLLTLDTIIPKMQETEEPFDRHIAAFIASKLVLLKEIRLDELASIPLLATNKTIIAIYLLGAAQLRVPQLRLPGLTYWLAMRTMPLLDLIHSRTVRKKYKDTLMGLAPLGSIPKLADLIVDAKYAAGDANGFSNALAAYRTNTASIAYYEAAENIEFESTAMGYRIAKMVAYLCLLGSLYIVVKFGSL